MQTRRPGIVIGIVFLVALLLACGSSKSSGGGQVVSTAPAGSGSAPTAAAAAPGKVGDKVQVGGTALTITKAERKAQIGDFQKASAGNTYVIVEVVVENVGTGKESYNPFFFKVKDSEGFEYQGTISTDAQALKSGELAAGEKARGSVVFEIKEASKGLVLTYDNNLFGGDPIKVQIPD